MCANTAPSTEQALRWSSLTGVDDDQDAVWEIVAWFAWRDMLEDEREGCAAIEIAPQTGRDYSARHQAALLN
jgi:hypothetical protein